MKWARIVRAWHAAELAFSESTASRERIELAEQKRRAEQKALDKKYRPPVDATVDTFLYLVLGILIGAILLRGC